MDEKNKRSHKISNEIRSSKDYNYTLNKLFLYKTEI